VFRPAFVSRGRWCARRLRHTPMRRPSRRLSTGRFGIRTGFGNSCSTIPTGRRAAPAPRRRSLPSLPRYGRRRRHCVLRAVQHAPSPCLAGRRLTAASNAAGSARAVSAIARPFIARAAATGPEFEALSRVRVSVSAAWFAIHSCGLRAGSAAYLGPGRRRIARVAAALNLTGDDGRRLAA
jgi:hypothetical protein